MSKSSVTVNGEGSKLLVTSGGEEVEPPVVGHDVTPPTVMPCTSSTSSNSRSSGMVVPVSGVQPNRVHVNPHSNNHWVASSDDDDDDEGLDGINLDGGDSMAFCYYLDVQTRVWNMMTPQQRARWNPENRARGGECPRRGSSTDV